MFKNVFTLCLLLTYSTFVFTENDPSFAFVNNTDQFFFITPTQTHSLPVTTPDDFHLVRTTPSNSILVGPHNTTTYRDKAFLEGMIAAQSQKSSLMLSYSIYLQGGSLVKHIQRVVPSSIINGHRKVTIEYSESDKNEIIIITR